MSTPAEIEAQLSASSVCRPDPAPRQPTRPTRPTAWSIHRLKLACRVERLATIAQARDHQRGCRAREHHGLRAGCSTDVKMPPPGVCHDAAVQVGQVDLVGPGAGPPDGWPGHGSRRVNLTDLDSRILADAARRHLGVSATTACARAWRSRARASMVVAGLGDLGQPLLTTGQQLQPMDRPCRRSASAKVGCLGAGHQVLADTRLFQLRQRSEPCVARGDQCADGGWRWRGSWSHPCATVPSFSTLRLAAPAPAAARTKPRSAAVKRRRNTAIENVSGRDAHWRLAQAEGHGTRRLPDHPVCGPWRTRQVA